MLDLYALYKQATGSNLFEFYFPRDKYYNFKLLAPGCVQKHVILYISFLIVGDCNIEQPGMTDLKGKAKWDAWNAKKGVLQDEAKVQYAELAITMIEKHGMSS